MRRLVPVDGSASAQCALRHALWLAYGWPESVILLVNVQNRESLALSELHAETDNDHELAERQSAKILHEAVRACEKAGVMCEIRAEFGQIPETIASVAEAAQIDQIIMGTRGLNDLAGLVLGSVARDVVHLAQIPVTLVKKNHRPRSYSSRANSTQPPL